MLHLPDALLIGPQRAGTTWIHHYLESRGDVGLPRRVKETFFFDRYYYRGPRWYARHFRPAAVVRRVVEVGPSYFHHEETPGRIAATLGAVRLICTLREPASRTYSLYLHRRRYGEAIGSFREAVDRHPYLLESSRYATVLRRWVGVFGKENIAVLFLEELARDPQAYAARLCAALGLPFEGVPPALHKPLNEATVPRSAVLARLGKRGADAMRRWGLYGVVETAKRLGLKPLFFGRPGKGKLPVLSEEDRRWLAAQFAEEIDQLEEMLNVDLSHWKAASAQRAA